MGCQSIKCSSCGTPVKACAMINGMCPTCASKQNTTSPPPPQNPS